jgi:hypothetical protein
MAIPNTTPTPNELYNGEMAKMGDTELRLVLVVTRATLGWELDSETGMRKQEDWLSHTQLKKKTGRSSASIAKAIDVCIKKGWIEARDKDSNILDTKHKRIGEKIFYRLGRTFLDKIKPESLESKEVVQDIQPESLDSLIKETKAYKRNVYTKNIYTVYEYYLKSFNRNPNLFKLSEGRKNKINARLKDAGEEMIIKAIKNISQSKFHMGDNDNHWKADLDWIIKSYEQEERLANMIPKNTNPLAKYFNKKGQNG